MFQAQILSCLGFYVTNQLTGEHNCEVEQNDA